MPQRKNRIIFSSKPVVFLADQYRKQSVQTDHNFFFIGSGFLTCLIVIRKMDNNSSGFKQTGIVNPYNAPVWEVTEEPPGCG
jgi:hypothetical protein